MLMNPKKTFWLRIHHELIVFLFVQTLFTLDGNLSKKKTSARRSLQTFDDNLKHIIQNRPWKFMMVVRIHRSISIFAAYQGGAWCQCIRDLRTVVSDVSWLLGSGRTVFLTSILGLLWRGHGNHLRQEVRVGCKRASPGWGKYQDKPIWWVMSVAASLLSYWRWFSKCVMIQPCSISYCRLQQGLWGGAFVFQSGIDTFYINADFSGKLCIFSCNWKGSWKEEWEDCWWRWCQGKMICSFSHFTLPLFENLLMFIKF